MQGVDSQSCTASTATPAVSTCSMNTRKTKRPGREGKVREMRETKCRQTTRRRGADNVPTTSTVHKTAAQPHVHAKRRTLTPGVDSPVCTTSAATPAIDAQHAHVEDEETREGKGEEEEERRGREGKTRQARQNRRDGEATLIRHPCPSGSVPTPVTYPSFVFM
jgi:hypothetical protein